jgi:hypothetical protein
MHGLVTAASTGDQTNLSHDGRIRAYDNLIGEVDPQQIGVSCLKSGKLILYNGLRAVNELLHVAVSS